MNRAALLLGAAIFLPMWCTVGKIDEVRIFLPYAFALTPLMVEAAMQRIHDSMQQGSEAAL